MPSETCYAYITHALIKVTSSTLNAQKVLTLLNPMEGDKV